MTQPDTELDPITVEVVRNKLEGIANEMQQTLLRSSFSPRQDAAACAEQTTAGSRAAHARLTVYWKMGSAAKFVL